MTLQPLEYWPGYRVTKALHKTSTYKHIENFCTI